MPRSAEPSAVAIPGEGTCMSVGGGGQGGGGVCNVEICRKLPFGDPKAGLSTEGQLRNVFIFQSCCRPRSSGAGSPRHCSRALVQCHAAPSPLSSSQLCGNPPYSFNILSVGGQTIQV